MERHIARYWRLGARLVFAAALTVGFGVRLPVGLAGASTVPTCDGHAATIVGTPGSDHITGTPGADVIVGLGGNDVVNGGGGHDIICGGKGDDTLSGGSGSDTLLGGTGDDIEEGNAGDDDLLGGSGDDTEQGNAGDDTLSGGIGSDTLNGGPGSDDLQGDAGDDTIESDGDDTIESDGDDTIDCQGEDAEEEGNCQDEIAQELVLEGMDAAGEFHDSNNDSYAGFDATAATSIDTDLTWQDGGASAVDTVAIKDVGDPQVLLTTLSRSGTYFCVADSASGLSYGMESSDFSTVAQCTGGW